MAEAVTLIAALTSAIVAIGGVAIGWRNANKVDQVHTIVNSQATKYEALARAAGFSQGQATPAPAPDPTLPQ